MNAQPGLPPMQDTRALTCAAFSALITQELGTHSGPQTTQAAQALLARLTHAGLAEATSTHTTLQIKMFGIRATGTSVTGLLRQWQREVADRLAQGVRQ